MQQALPTSVFLGIMSTQAAELVWLLDANAQHALAAITARTLCVEW